MERDAPGRAVGARPPRAHARSHAPRRHPRSPRRHLPPLRHRSRLARPPLREDALRQRPARRPLPRGEPRPRGSFAGRRWAAPCSTISSPPGSAPDGGLIVGFDADDPVGEGAYYTFTPAELAAALGPARRAARGRALRGDRRGRASARRAQRAPPARRGRASRASSTSTRARSRRRVGRAPGRGSSPRARSRPPPAADDKELAAWNGLALAALADAGRTLGEPRYVAAAQRVGALPRRRGAGTRRRARCAAACAGARRSATASSTTTRSPRWACSASTPPTAIPPGWWHAAAITAALVERFHDAARDTFVQAPQSRPPSARPTARSRSGAPTWTTACCPPAAPRPRCSWSSSAPSPATGALRDLGLRALRAAAPRVRESPFSSGFFLVGHRSRHRRRPRGGDRRRPERPAHARARRRARPHTDARVLPVFLPAGGAARGARPRLPGARGEDGAPRAADGVRLPARGVRGAERRSGGAAQGAGGGDGGCGRVVTVEGRGAPGALHVGSSPRSSGSAWKERARRGSTARDSTCAEQPAGSARPPDDGERGPVRQAGACTIREHASPSCPGVPTILVSALTSCSGAPTSCSGAPTSWACGHNEWEHTHTIWKHTPTIWKHTLTIWEPAPSRLGAQAHNLGARAHDLGARAQLVGAHAPNALGDAPNGWEHGLSSWELMPNSWVYGLTSCSGVPNRRQHTATIDAGVLDRREHVRDRWKHDPALWADVPDRRKHAHEPSGAHAQLVGARAQLVGAHARPDGKSFLR